MSLQFNNSSGHNGIVQIYEKECGFNPGDISGNTTRLKQFTADANLAFDELFTIARKKAGSWQPDDSNYSDTYSIFKMNLVSGRREYAVTTDEEGALILDFYRVLVADRAGILRDIGAVDQQIQNNVNNDTTSFVDGRGTTGVPSAYDKTGNGIFFDVIPDYSITNGIWIFGNREPFYFSYDDTTRKPGVPGNLHRWFAIKPAYDYCRRKGKKNLNALKLEVDELKILIAEEYTMRQKDVKGNLRMNVEDCE